MRASGHDVRVIVISPGVIETEVLDHVTDPNTLANYEANKAQIGGGIPSEHVADLIALVPEICITPMRQSY